MKTRQDYWEQWRLDGCLLWQQVSEWWSTVCLRRQCEREKRWKAQIKHEHEGKANLCCANAEVINSSIHNYFKCDTICFNRVLFLICLRSVITALLAKPDHSKCQWWSTMRSTPAAIMYIFCSLWLRNLHGRPVYNLRAGSTSAYWSPIFCSTGVVIFSWRKWCVGIRERGYWMI